MVEDSFEEGQVERVTDRMAAEALIVDVDGFEGPLDVLRGASVLKASLPLLESGLERWPVAVGAHRRSG